MGLHLNVDDTPVVTATATLAAGVPVELSFPATATFRQHDLLSVSVDPTTGPGDVAVTCVWRLEGV